VDANTVSVVINVSDANSAAAVAGVEENLTKLGAAGARSGAQVKAGMDQAGAGMLSAVEKTRLASEEMGVRLPRAMITLISQSKAAQVALNGVSTAMIGLAGIQIGAMIFEAAIRGAEKLWKNYLSLNSAANEYQETLEKQKQEDYWNSHSIETTTYRIKEATRAAEAYRGVAQSIWKEGWVDILQGNLGLGVGELTAGHKLAGAGVAQQAGTAKLTEEQARQQHEMTLLAIRATHPNDRLGMQLAEIQENYSYDRELDKLRNPGATPDDAGLKKKQLEEQVARNEAAKGRDEGRGGRAAGNRAEEAEERRHAQELQKTGEMERRAQEEMLTGSARIRLHGVNEIASLDTKDPELRKRQAAVIMQETNRQAEEADREAQDRRDAAANRQTDKEAEERKRQTDQARRASEETDRIEAQARVRGLSAEKQKTASIQAELEERLQHYQDELNDQQISQEDYNRRAAAAQAEANAQMVEAAAEARKKMAGEFESFFKGMEDPKKYLKELGDKAAGQAAATLWQRFAQRGAPGSGGGGQGSGVFDTVLDKLHLGKRPGAQGEHPGGPGATHTTAQQALLSVATATIHVGTAVIAGAQATGTREQGPGYSSGGGTALYAPGASAGSGGFGGGSTATGDFGGGAGQGADSPGASSWTSRISSGVGAAKQGYNLLKQLKGGFGGQGSGGDSGGSGGFFAPGESGESGAPTSDGQGIQLAQLSPGAGSEGAAGAGAGAGMAGSAAGFASGAMGVWSAHEGTGGAGGAIQGAMSGAQAGASFGPWGMAAGAVVGGVIGFLGSTENARVYDLKTVRPRLGNDRLGNDQDQYEHGSMDYASAYSDMQSLQTEAFRATSAMGPSGRRYRDEYILPEIKQAEGKLDAMEKSGRSQYTASAASYAVGTDYVPGTGMAVIHQGERIIPSDQNERLTRAVESQGKMPVRQAAGGDAHLHVHAIDAAGVAAFLGKYKHDIRSAVNDSFAENSGGGMN
jgi:hypothetical protein